MSNEKQVTLFDRLYEGAKETIKAIQKPMVQRQLKRKFQAAYDDLLNKKYNKEKELSDNRFKLEDYDLEKVIKIKQDLQGIDLGLEAVQKEYFEMFNEQLKVD